jgi:hypothetical protein
MPYSDDGHICPVPVNGRHRRGKRWTCDCGQIWRYDYDRNYTQMVWQMIGRDGA